MGVGHGQLPLWDAALERMAFDADQLPEYQRVDVELADATERPSDGEYDRYVYLVDVFRERGTTRSRIRDVVPFAIQPVLFNSLLVQSNRDLAEIARIVGADPAPFESWAESTAAALEETLWDEEHAVYVDYDVRDGARGRRANRGGSRAALRGVPTPARAAQMVEVMAGSRVVAVGEAGWITSQAPRDPGFQPARYWRGPIWPILNWVLQRGLDRYGYPLLAADVRRAMIELARSAGFREHYSPVTGRGQGERSSHGRQRSFSIS